MKLFLSSIFCLTLVVSCTFTKKIQSGEEAYQLRQYALASEMLVQDYNGTKNKVVKAEKAFYVGRSFAKMGKFQEAIKWLSIADEFGYGLDATRELGLAQKKDENYRGAIATFQKYEQNGGAIQEARKEISFCEQAMQWKENKASYDIEPLNIGTSGSAYAPVLFEKNFIVFTSDRTESTGDASYLWTGREFSDLFIVSKTRNEPLLFDKQLNTEHNEGASCFNADFSEIFFTRCYNSSGDDYCKILRSVRQGKSWSNPEEVFYMEEKSNYRQPALIEQDSVLVFSSDQKGGNGGYDLYYTFLDEDGWSVPEPMPSKINTEGDETFPTVDNDTLYFSSDFLPGMGGLDVFKTYLQNGNEWSKPINVQAPINSGADDFSLIYERKMIGGNIRSQGYFSSSRHGDGTDLIYKFSKIETVVDQPVDEEEEPIADVPVEKKKVYLAIRVVENLYEEEGNPNSTITGKKALRRSGLTIQNKEGNIQEKKTNLSGRIILEVDWEDRFSILANKSGYLNNKAIKEIPAFGDDITEDVTYNMEIVLDKIYADKEIILNNIYYEFDKWDIQEEAKPSLDDLTDILVNNPQISINLASHTDCQGDRDYNADLAQKRADSAVQYIIGKGIAANRLLATGYGEDRLAINCNCDDCTEEQHQTNRRTTFQIIEN